MNKRFIRSVFVILVVAVGFGFGCSKSLEPVNEIHIGGMPLDIKNGILSKLITPVEADAIVQVPGKHDTITVNIFKSDKGGSVQGNPQPEIILVKDTDHFKLNKTMSGNKLSPGTYLMNIVYAGKTDRVLFAVK